MKACISKLEPSVIPKRLSKKLTSILDEIDDECFHQYSLSLPPIFTCLERLLSLPRTSPYVSLGDAGLDCQIS